MKSWIRRLQLDQKRWPGKTGRPFEDVQVALTPHSAPVLEREVIRAQCASFTVIMDRFGQREGPERVPTAGHKQRMTQRLEALFLASVFLAVAPLLFRYLDQGLNVWLPQAIAGVAVILLVLVRRRTRKLKIVLRLADRRETILPI